MRPVRFGNITTLTSGATQQYRCDAIQRLTRVETTSLQRIDAWTYDGTGNRLSRQAGQGPVLTLSYPPTSHRVSVAGVARSYDANGNTISGIGTFSYGDHNRLVAWSGGLGGGSASYQHNARGERVWKQSMAGAASMSGDKLPPECLAVQGLILQSFLYDEAGRVIVDRNDPCSDGPLTNFEFVWLDDQPLAVIDADPNLPSPQLVGHITSDHLHTPRAISNAAGTVTWTWAPVSGNSTSGGSNVFGDRPAQATGAPFNTRAFNLRLPGQYLDAESGLHYNYFRDYEPGTGRYVQSDPIGLEGGISSYGYAGQNPILLYDPLGLLIRGPGCSDRQWRQIEKAEDRVREALRKCQSQCHGDTEGKSCVPCERVEFILRKLQSTRVGCDRDLVHCALARYSENSMSWLPDSFDIGRPGFGPLCGCLENSILHEMLHISGMGHPGDPGDQSDPVNRSANRCFPCGLPGSRQ